MPGLLGTEHRFSRVSWQRVLERSRVFAVRAGEEPTDEREWLGLPPGSTPLAQGTLCAAAFGVATPERSVLFQTSTIGLDADERMMPITLGPEESEAVFAAISPRLNRKRWTFVEGEGEINLLVREQGSIDVESIDPHKLLGGQWEPRWPNGDDQDVLRNLVEDSREALEGLEFNRRRRDEGHPTAGFVWPWGPGLELRLPNLAVARGELVRYYSPNLRLKGAARLASYWHGRLDQAPHERLRDAAATDTPSVVWQAIEGAEAAERWEAEVEERVFEPLILGKAAGELRLTVIDPAGLGFNFDTRRLEVNTLPFDSRVVEGERLRTHALFEAVQKGLAF